MAHKRIKRLSIGLFDVPGRRDEDDAIGVLGGPADGSGLLGDPGPSSGLFDAPDRAPGEMPGLFDRPRQTAADGGPLEKPARAAVRGLFDKPARGGSDSRG
jgi:hypothetical protein